MYACTHDTCSVSKMCVHVFWYVTWCMYALYACMYSMFFFCKCTHAAVDLWKIVAYYVIPHKECTHLEYCMPAGMYFLRTTVCQWKSTYLQLDVSVNSYVCVLSCCILKSRMRTATRVFVKWVVVRALEATVMRKMPMWEQGIRSQESAESCWCVELINRVKTSNSSKLFGKIVFFSYQGKVGHWQNFRKVPNR